MQKTPLLKQTAAPPPPNPFATARLPFFYPHPTPDRARAPNTRSTGALPHSFRAPPIGAKARLPPPPPAFSPTPFFSLFGSRTGAPCSPRTRPSLPTRGGCARACARLGPRHPPPFREEPGALRFASSAPRKRRGPRGNTKKKEEGPRDSLLLSSCGRRCPLPSSFTMQSSTSFAASITKLPKFPPPPTHKPPCGGAGATRLFFLLAAAPRTTTLLSSIPPHPPSPTPLLFPPSPLRKRARTRERERQNPPSDPFCPSPPLFESNPIPPNPPPVERPPLHPPPSERVCPPSSPIPTCAGAASTTTSPKEERVVPLAGFATESPRRGSITSHQPIPRQLVR
jgi:hypothetical protein